MGVPVAERINSCRRWRAMLRLLFEKTGTAVWISHLDLMRLFQRAFKRAGLPLTHTQGFNPRPSVSIALPLSVGVESHCELLDFELDGVAVDANEIRDRLNRCLVSGVKVHTVYNTGRKLKELRFLNCEVELLYDGGVPENAVEEISQLFQRDCLIVPKKSKNGPQDQDIIPMIRRLNVCVSQNKIILCSTVCCQNPSLNPAQLAAAVSLYLPIFVPDHTICRRTELLDEAGDIFR